MNLPGLNLVLPSDTSDSRKSNLLISMILLCYFEYEYFAELAPS